MSAVATHRQGAWSMNSGLEKIPKRDRLQRVFALLAAGPPSGDAATAMQDVEQALKRVEDEWTLVPDDRAGNWGWGARMYLPPPHVDMAWSDIPQGRRVELNRHVAEFHHDGRLLIRDKATGAVLLDRAGSGLLTPHNPTS